ncbi:MAG: hypothetical protein ACR2MQ_16855 [Gemmatimonadaceae bacterium]
MRSTTLSADRAIKRPMMRVIMRGGMYGALVTALAAAAVLAAPQVALAQAVSVDFPLGLGFQVPAYDRVDGLSLPFGPSITLGEDRLLIEPTLTYRSHLGKVDPSLALTAHVDADSVYSIRLAGARGTFSNDNWIRSDPINSLLAFGLGRDGRNYFRADRAEARFIARLPLPADVAQLFVGARAENDWSTGWRLNEHRGPFSIFGRHNQIDGIDRLNPEINRGHINSLIGGGRLGYKSDRNTLRLDALLEAAANNAVKGRFEQLTLDGHVAVPTFAGHRFELDGHLVTTGGGQAPAQRYAYIGGSGTLATLDLLQLGGDHLFFFDTRYIIPIPRVTLPFVGSPFIAPRFAAGAAAIGGYGQVTQNVGLRLGAGPIQVDVVVNPRTHQRDQGIGISFSR